MKRWIEWFFGGAERGGDLSPEADIERLTADMTQAFYRGDVDTVDLLRDRGARFTEEMLMTAVAQKHAALIQRCIFAGVAPSADVMSRARDRSHPIHDAVKRHERRRRLTAPQADASAS